MRCYSAFHIVIFTKSIHSFHELVHINEWSDDDNASEDIPQPVIGRAQHTIEATTLEFVANSVANGVVPDEPCDSKGHPTKKEKHEAIVCGLFAVVFAGYSIERISGLSENNNIVYAESDEA